MYSRMSLTLRQSPAVGSFLCRMNGMWTRLKRWTERKGANHLTRILEFENDEYIYWLLGDAKCLSHLTVKMSLLSATPIFLKFDLQFFYQGPNLIKSFNFLCIDILWIIMCQQGRSGVAKMGKKAKNKELHVQVLTIKRYLFVTSRDLFLYFLSASFFA